MENKMVLPVVLLLFLTLPSATASTEDAKDYGPRMLLLNATAFEEELKYAGDTKTYSLGKNDTLTITKTENGSRSEIRREFPCLFNTRATYRPFHTIRMVCFRVPRRFSLDMHAETAGAPYIPFRSCMGFGESLNVCYEADGVLNSLPKSFRMNNIHWQNNEGFAIATFQAGNAYGELLQHSFVTEHPRP